MHWFLNTHPILMHLAYLFTCCFNFRFLLIFFVNSRWFYLNKCCELKERFLRVWYGIEQTIIDNAIDEWHGRLRACVRAKGGHFEQLLWQYSVIWQQTFKFLSNVTRFLDCCFWKLPHIRTSNFRKIMRQHIEGMVGNIVWVCWKFTYLSAVKKFWKSVKNWQSYRREFGVLVFWDTVYFIFVLYIVATFQLNG